jgi:hypothetical protein
MIAMCIRRVNDVTRIEDLGRERLDIKNAKPIRREM